MKSTPSFAPRPAEKIGFNDVSRQLMDSYQGLESQVARLNAALRSAQGERLRQLREKERLAARLEGLLAALPGGILVLDADGRIQEYNPAAQALLGMPLQDEAWTDVLSRVADPAGHDGDVRFLDGRIVSLSSCPLMTEPGRILLLQDVTETRELQELLHRQQRLSALGEMAASLAHQLRTPLTSALLYTGHLNRSRLGQQERVEVTEKIQGRLRHLERMINDMLSFARGASAGRDEFTLAELIDEVTQTLKPQLMPVGGCFEVMGEDQGIRLRGNREALAGALLNLATNALQARPRGLILILRVAQGDGVLRLSLSDNGPGIDKAVQQQIFTPFFTTRPEGTGLGLAVVRAVMEAHGGKVGVESEPGEGSVFHLELPLHHTPRHLNSRAGCSDEARRRTPETSNTCEVLA